MNTLQDILDQKFLDACQESSLEDIKKCAKLIKNNPRTVLGFSKVCLRGDIEMIDFLIEQKLYPEKNHNEMGFSIVYKEGYLNLAKYFIDKLNKSEEITDKKNNKKYQELIEEGFLKACSSPNAKLVKYFLTEPAVETYNLLDKINDGMVRACYENRFETGLYLMHSKDLQKHADPTNANYEAVERLILAGHMNFFEYLVLDVKIKITPEFKEDLLTNDYFAINHKEKALEILNTREANDKIEILKDNLTAQLSSKKTGARVKI